MSDWVGMGRLIQSALTHDDMTGVVSKLPARQRGECDVLAIILDGYYVCNLAYFVLANYMAVHNLNPHYKWIPGLRLRPGG